MNHTIIIAGAGGIGRAAALILANLQDKQFNIYLGDISEEACKESVEFVGNSSSAVDYFIMTPESNSPKELEVFKAGNIILDCLPGKLAPKMAQIARDNNMHYAIYNREIYCNGNANSTF